MGGQLLGVLRAAGSALRTVGSGLNGIVAPLRAKDGTFGTQRMHSAQQEQQRRASYPHD